MLLLNRWDSLSWAFIAPGCDYLGMPELLLFHGLLDSILIIVVLYCLRQKNSSYSLPRLLSGIFSKDTLSKDARSGTKLVTDNQQANNTQSKELLLSKAFFDTSIDGVVVLNQKGNVVQTSPSFAKMIGYSVEETLALNVADWDAQWTQEELKLILQGHHELPLIETRHRRKDGSVYDVEISYSHLELEGDMMHFCICRDISERKRAEVALQLSQERLQLALEASGDGLWDLNLQTGEAYHSPRYQEILGYDTNRFTLDFDGWKQSIHPDDRATVLASLAAHLKDSSVKYSLDYRVRCKSGNWKWITDYGKVVARDGQGRPLRMIGAYQDISDRKQAEEALHHQKEMFQAIVNHIPAMIILFNHQGQVEFINPELERLLGWSLQECQHQKNVLIEAYPDPAYRQQVLAHMRAAKGQWKTFTTLNAQGQSLEIAWANVQLSDGHFVGIGQDISEQVRVENERNRQEMALRDAMETAEAANLAKSMFLANMSHELRTPLNVILGFTQVMAHDPSLTPNQREDLQTIRRSGDHLLSLINDVLDLSKIEAGHDTLEEAGFDLISQLHTLQTMMAERAKAKQLQLTFDIAPKVPQFIIADEQKLRQILLNLLSNAVKFTNQGGVTLRVSLSETQFQLGTSFLHQSAHLPVMLQFEVIDTGIGIEAQELETIFDAFVQAEAGKKSFSGTGLGLTISRKLLELMGGEISVKSTPGLGSQFTCIVPVYPVSSIAAIPEEHDRIVIGLAPWQPIYRVLVVDDQLENRLLMVRLLTQLGLEVREATTGQEAVQIWQDWQPELTWMDIRMPTLDGYEATRQIRAIEQRRGEDPSIIIALTAQASQSDRTLALAAGCNDYISKPFRQETVFLKMSEYLGLKYLYTDPQRLLEASPRLSYPNQDLNCLSEPAKPIRFSTDWLQAVENAAVCGNDWKITELAAQLPPELATLSHCLKELASQFHFEQIQDWARSKIAAQPSGQPVES